MPEKKALRLYNWNAELAEDEAGNEEVEVSFRIQGINKNNIFIAIFQTGKGVIENIQGNGTFADYMEPLTELIFLIMKSLKKSK